MKTISMIQLSCEQSYFSDYEPYLVEFNKIRDELFSLGQTAIAEKLEKYEPERNYFYTPAVEFLADSELVVSLMSKGFSAKIKSSLPQDSDLQNKIQSCEKSIDALMSQLAGKLNCDSDALKNNYYNNRCECHISNVGLHMMNRTMLLENSCTDDLTQALANGWRIISALPQPDQRRPDYILGKYDPNFNYNEGHEVKAERNPTAL